MTILHQILLLKLMILILLHTTMQIHCSIKLEENHDFSYVPRLTPKYV